LNTRSNCRSVLFVSLSCALMTVLSAGAFGQQTKPWTEWTKKDAEKILADSPWSQTQVETDTSEMFFSPTSDPNRPGVRTTSTTGQRDTQGATNQATNVKYRIRFFSARPVRQALVRLIELSRKPDAKTTERLHSFADVQATESIIVTVTYESTDQRFGNKAMQAFNSAVTATLKNNTYLELKSGQRLFLEEYVAPGKDGFGARFIFLRKPEGNLFITPDSSEVRFYSEVASNIKLNMRFRIADMNYNGKIEY
jgi:hypothetical protein